jgi:hypothetical protein
VRSFLKLVVLVYALALGVGNAEASGYLYGSDGATSDLVLINTADGSSTLVGNMAGLSNGVGLAYNPNTSTMYTRDFDTLFTVDYTSAATTAVGPSGSFITALAFSTDYSTLYSVDQSTGDFYHVAPGTGAATLVGNTGISTPLDLTMSSTGTLYACDIGGDIYTVNPASGASTLLWPLVTPDGLTSIQFDPFDNLYGVTLTSDMLISVNLGDGSSSVGGGPIIRQDIRGMAFVPEPASFMLIGLGGLALSALRRR